MKDNDSKEKKTSAFKDVDKLFEDAAPKDAAKDKAPAGQAAAQAASDEKKGDELALVATNALHAFPDHPYTVDEGDNDMAKLVDSIQREGLLERIVVRCRKEGGFEILSGHRRHRACQILGLSEVPVIIKNNLTNDQAILLMVDANLKRENVLPIDEARALKMQMDAMNRMGQRPAHGKVKRTDEMIAEKISKNRMYVQRKVKLLELTPDLQKAVNEKTLSETPAFEIAYLPPKVQELFYDWMTMEDRAPTVAQAISLRQHQQELAKAGGKGKQKDAALTEEQIDRIMSGERLAEIFPPPVPEKTPQAEQKHAAGPLAPAAGPVKEDSPAVPASAVAEGGPVPVPDEFGGGQPQPGGVADAKAIPFQTPNTNIPQPGRSSYNAAAPAPEPAQTAAEATKAYIRTEYMAELRKDNVILPKVDVKTYVSHCATNDEYVAAIKEALAKGQEKMVGEKAVESKAAPPLNAISTPATEIINRVEAREAAEKAAKPTEPPKVDKPPAASAKEPEAVKAESTPASTAPEPAKADKPIVAPDKTPEPSKPEPAKSDAKDSPPAVGFRSSAVPLPKPSEPGKVPVTVSTEPAKADSGTKALDDFLKNKSRPNKGKGMAEKNPIKAK